MKSCIRIPRILLPRKGYRKWSVIACDQFTSDRAYWERVARNTGGAPSSLRFILPEVYLGEEDEERIRDIHASMYTALEDEWMYKLDRGFVLTERTTTSGTRRGIVACIDLEAYTCGAGESSPIRSSEEVVKDRLPPRVALRRGAVLEFPHAIVFYRDKKDRAMHFLEEEELERLYDFDLMEGGGHLTGYFIPEDIAAEIIPDLQGKGEPSFAVADGNHSVAAAKAYWEEIKADMPERESRSHPARFMLVELVNIYDKAVIFHPIHRLVKEVDSAAFCDWFMKEIPCRREGNLLFPALPASPETVERVDGAIEAFMRANTGKVDYIHGDKEIAEFSRADNCAGIALEVIDKDEFFAYLKGGKNLPKKTFSIGEGAEKRYYTEGREISDD